MGLLNHAFVSVVADGSDATQVQPSNWNADHVYTGGNSGAILLRDTSVATYGASWLSSVAAGSFLRAAGVAALPAWSTVTIPNTATRGDIFIASAANVMTAVATGAAGTVLIGGTDPSWSANPAVTSLSAGTTPASAGALRIPHATGLYSRNSANSGDIFAVGVGITSADQVYLGDPGYITELRGLAVLFPAVAGAGLASLDVVAYKVGGVDGINASITTAGLVGKTITFTKGIITGFS